MFTRRQIEELIALGWAPEYDDALNIVGFDKTVRSADGVVELPASCAGKASLALLAGDSKYRLTGEGIELVSRHWRVYAAKKVRFA